MEEIKMTYVLCEGNTPIFYETIGKGMPILFIHPPGMGHVTFQKQRPLSKYFQLIFYDMRGNGKSGTGQEETITMQLLVEDIKNILDDLNIEKAVILGYSNGGSLAQEFALTYPERTKALIMSGSFPEVDSFILRNEFRLGILAMSLGGMSLLANVLAFAHCRIHETAFFQQLSNHIKKGNPNIIKQMYVEGLHYKATKRLHEISVPVLLIYGKRAFYLNHYRNDFRKKLKDLDIVFVDKSAHQVPTKFAIEFNYIVTQFLHKKFQLQR